MKQVSKLIIGLVALSAMTGVADEYGYFSRADTSSSDWLPSTINLSEGDRLILLNSNYQSDYGHAVTLLIDYGAGYVATETISIRYYRTDSYGRIMEYSPESFRTFIGPCTVVPASLSTNARVVRYKIIRASDNSISPSNVISLPADVNGDMQLVFESSDDLLTWTQEFSFTHNSTNSGGKFFRTRLIQGAGQ